MSFGATGLWPLEVGMKMMGQLLLSIAFLALAFFAARSILVDMTRPLVRQPLDDGEWFEAPLAAAPSGLKVDVRPVSRPVLNLPLAAAAA